MDNLEREEYEAYREQMFERRANGLEVMSFKEWKEFQAAWDKFLTEITDMRKGPSFETVQKVLNAVEK